MRRISTPIDGRGARPKSFVSSSQTRSGDTVVTSARGVRHRGAGGGTQFVAEARGELRRPQQAQRVLGERLRRDDVDAPGPDVGDAAEGVDDRVVADPARDHVHAEVAPAQVLLKRDLRTALDGEIPMPGPGRPLAPRQRDVGLALSARQLDDGKRRADDVDPADRLASARPARRGSRPVTT